MAFRIHTSRVVGLVVCLFLLLAPPARSQEPGPVVHAVLFYSPTCPHCHEVITTFLVPLQEEFGSRIVILGLDTSQGWANEIYWAAIREYEVPEESWAVPLMLVEETVLVGGFEIPDQFRTILEEGLERGGIDLPDLPALLTFMEEQGLLDTRYPDRRIARQSLQEAPAETPPAQDPEEEPIPPTDTATTVQVEESGEEDAASPDTVSQEEPLPVDTPEEEGDVQAAAPEETPVDPDPGETEEAQADSVSAAPPPGPSQTGPLDMADAARELESMTMWDRFNHDPRGNSLSVVVLIGMLLSLALRGHPGKVRGRLWPTWVIPALVVVGVGVAAYLSYIEITHTQAVCGPVGDCNTVNQSSYATLFGFLPVGVLGLMGYAVILALWGAGRWGPEGLRGQADLGLWGAALFGTLFSIYLTFLEPFVIGATCAWCLTSAVVMTLILWATSPLAARVWPGRAE